ncbi:hypothetical protein ES705_37017 [subsurface metagenome]
MARKKSGYKRMNKIEPAVQTLWFNVITPADTTDSKFIDLSQVASLVNRRFYRQGINWAVSGIETYSTVSTEGYSSQGNIVVSKLPSTWVMSNAWEKGFRVWQRMNNEALAETESVRPRFLDFKIYADSVHHAAGFGANLLPIALEGAFAPGEWESSKITYPDTTLVGNSKERDILAVGASFPGTSVATGRNAVSLIEGYAASRGLPNIADPNTPDDAEDTSGVAPENWMAAVFNEGNIQTEQVIDIMTDENNIAPYPFENDGVNADTMYPNGANQGMGLEVHEYGYITPTTIGNQTNFKGSMFPCGLIRMDITNSLAAPGPGEQSRNMSTLIGVRLVPGSHRGYLCEPMTEM